MLNTLLTCLLNYAQKHGLIASEDRVYSANRLLEILAINEFEEVDIYEEMPLAQILDELTSDAVRRGLIEDGIVYRDLFDTKIMGALIPRPSEVIATFTELYEQSPKKATDWYYRLSCDSNYIRRDRIAKDKKWKYDTDYGTIDITINLSKPEKDPKAIAAAKTMKQSGYPKCPLCKENEGYAGHLNAARQNHRIIPITINQTP